MTQKRGTISNGSRLIPNTTQTPNLYIDRAMALLTGAEFKTLLYAVRRIMGFHLTSAQMGISQFMTGNGIIGHDGQPVETGTGLGKAAQMEACQALVGFGFLVEITPAAGRRATEYALQLDETAIRWDLLGARAEAEAQRHKAQTQGARQAVAHDPAPLGVGQPAAQAQPEGAQDDQPEGPNAAAFVVCQTDRNLWSVEQTANNLWSVEQTAMWSVEQTTMERIETKRNIDRSDPVLAFSDLLGAQADDLKKALVSHCENDRDRALVVWYLSGTFATLTGTRPPDNLPGLLHHWWQPLLDVAEAVGWDHELGARAIDQTLARMKTPGAITPLTIKSEMAALARRLAPKQPGPLGVVAMPALVQVAGPGLAVAQANGRH